LDADLLFAAFADAEGPLLDAEERLVDLLEKEFLSIAQAEHHRLGVLGGGQIDLVGEIVGVEVALLHQRLTRRLEKTLLALLEHLLEPLQILLIQAHTPGAIRHLSKPSSVVECFKPAITKGRAL